MSAQRGFTLIELAIVLVVITILIGGLAVPLSAQIQARRIAETKRSLEAAREAIIGYALSHVATGQCDCKYDFTGPVPVRVPASTCPVSLCPVTSTADLDIPTTRPYLPCPDDGSGTPGNEGGRRTDGKCLTSRGGLPWRALGLDEADAWGQRFTYAVAADFSGNTSGFVSTPTPSASPLRVYPDASCAGTPIADGMAAVIVSHGPNGRGAQNKSGGTPLAPTAVPADERHNLPSPSAIAPCTDNDFVSRPPQGRFDDLLVWLSPSALFSRVCPAGGCP